MSGLDELIKEWCADGVEFRKIGEISKVLRGKRLTRDNLSEEGKYPVFHGGLEPLGFYHENNRDANTVMIINVGASAGTVGYCDKEFWASDGCYCIEHSGYVISRFMYLVLVSKEMIIKSKVRRAGIPTLEAKVIEDIVIPVPPRPVQEEIVRVLDMYANCIEELKVVLHAERYMRQKQYEFYRKHLMIVEKDFSKMSLKDVTMTFRGEYITKKSAKQGSIPVILGGQEPAYYIDRANHDGEIVVVARSGVSAGFVSYWDEPIFVTDGFGYEAKKSVVIPKYLYYILKNKEKELNGMKRGAGVPHISGEALSKLEFPIPPLVIQEQIVLDNEKLDNKYNELLAALEAEIKLCQKQYEYYLDKLLTFKEKAC